jgi:hypothetical protein
VISDQFSVFSDQLARSLFCEDEAAAGRVLLWYFHGDYRFFYGSTWTWTESGRFLVSCLAGLRDGGISCARERLVEVQSSSACSLGAYWSDT